MKELNEKLKTVLEGIESPATPKEFLPALRRKRDALEAEIAEAKQKSEHDAKLKAKEAKEAFEKKEAEKAAKKARVRKQISTGKRVKKKAKRLIKAVGRKTIKHVRIAKAAKRGKKRAKGFAVPKYVKKFNRGRAGDNLRRDMQRTAKAPGKHKQKPNHIHKYYYEKRANRTDVSTKWKLAGGGGIFGGRSNAALAKDMKYFNKRQKHEVDYAKSAGRKKVKYKKKDFFEVGGGVGSCGCTHNEGGRMQDSEVKYLEYIRKWQVENLPSKYHDMPLEDVPDSAFTKDQLKKRDELLAKLHNEEFAKGGHIIVGYTKTGKRIYADASHPSHQSFTAQEREDAKKYHGQMSMPGLKKYGQRAKGGYAKGGKAHPEKVGKVMREFKAHKLKSHGKVVTDRDQAIAIALSEANMSKKKVQ